MIVFAALGLFRGLAIRAAASGLVGWTVGIGVGTVAAGILASAPVGIIFGFVPALRAADLNPTDALRYE